MDEPSFGEWLDLFVDEKGLDIGHVFEVPGRQWEVNIIPFDSVIATAKAATPAEQETIRNTLARMDYRNVNPMPFFEHLAKGMAL